MENKLRIAVIDDGINNNIVTNLEFNLLVKNNLKFIVNKSNMGNIINHATICAMIINNYAHKADIGSIKILNDKTKRSTAKQLTSALYWCLKNDVKIINLSIGTVNYRDFDEIISSINFVSQSGLIIIAACNNSNIYTIPACLTNTIGVKCKKEYHNSEYDYNTYPIDGIEVLASGIHKLPMLGDSYSTPPSNSYAAPLITAIVNNILLVKPNLTLEQIKNILYKNSNNFNGQDYNPCLTLSTDWINDIKGVGHLTEDSILTVNQTLWADLLTNQDNKNFMGFIRQEISFDEENICGKIFDYVFYSKIINQKITDNKLRINVPVVLFNATNSNLPQEINELFKRKGYFSIIISNKISPRREMIPYHTQVNNYISYITDKYKCDIAILDVDDKYLVNLLKNSLEIDIEVLEDKSLKNCSSGKTFVIELSGNITCNSLFKIIINMLK